MALLTTAPRGTKDILPADTGKWQYVEKTLLNTAELFGFKELRIPTFEHTELFNRSVGETTDVVSKEMYTFLDKGDRSITLRPEGTAGLARAAIQNGLLGDALPVKLSYVISCFRYEKPQSGRFREFEQFGVEMYGATSPAADCELISLVNEAYITLGVQGIHVEINSIGCKTCRAEYHKALKAYFEAQKADLCPTCLERLDKNPMRILDCKSPTCGKIAAGAPKVLDYLCGDCQTHFDGVQTLLKVADIPFKVNATIVRGLDYYTRTVFECVYTDKDGRNLVCGGGGRYGGLLAELGGPDMEGIGFAMGLERLISVMEEQGCDFPPANTCDVYIASMGDKAAVKAFQLASALRSEGFFAQCDLMGRSLKAQMKYANKIGAKYSIVLGEDELAKNEAVLKSMFSGSTRPVPLGDTFTDVVYEEILNTAYNDLEEAMDTIEHGPGCSCGHC
ncbi:MAG: histidine--tRNA ligase [Angelakisella sp.]|nr:histidine--tRNA ligase [Angelakisella sp.]